MDILFNSKPAKVSSSSLLTVLQELNYSNLKGIAVAVNQEVIPKPDWIDYQLSQNDEIILIQATQGG